MGFLKYWHVIGLFFIASTAFGNDNPTREGRFLDYSYESLYDDETDDEESDEWSLLDDAYNLLEECFVSTLEFFQGLFAPVPNIKVEYHIALNKGSNSEFCEIRANSNCKHDFKKNNRLKVLIHGYFTNYTTDWIRNMTNQLTKMKSTTVIAIDWSVNGCLGGVPPVENTFLYDCTFDSMKPVINRTATFLTYLTKAVQSLRKPGEKPWKHIHIMGHSMGAHIAGKVAKKFKKYTGLTVDRVTGLDPAQPCFEETGPKWRLDKSHANFVDVIHTNSDESNDSTLGLYKEMGHVDIYPNNGNNQIDCYNGSNKGLLTLLTCPTIIKVGISLPFHYEEEVCNHGKAAEYMTLSMIKRGCDYRAVPWDDKEKLKTQTVDQVCKNSACVQMGFNAKKPSNEIGSSTKYFIDMSKLREECRLL